MGRYITETDLIKKYTGTWGVDKKFSFVRDYNQSRKNVYVNLVFIVFLGFLGGQRLYMKDEFGYVYPILSVLSIAAFFALGYFFGQNQLLKYLPLLLMIPVFIRMIYDFFTFKGTVAGYNQRLAHRLHEKYRTKRSNK